VPPWPEVEAALLHLALPGVGAAFLVALAVRLLGARAAPVAAALGVAAGSLLANHFRAATTFLPESGDFLASLGMALERPAGEAVAEAPRFWLPWLALAALLIDLVARLRPDDQGVNWSAKTLFCAFAGRLLVPDDLRLSSPWLPWALSVAMASQWAILWWLSSRWRNGGAMLAASACLAAGGVVMLHAHSARLADFGLMMACAVAGVGLVGLMFEGDFGSPSGAVAVWLSGLMVAGRWETSEGSAVPLACFAVAGLAPLALLALVPSADRWPGWRGVAAAVWLGVVGAGVAVGLAMRYAPLTF